MQRTRLKGGSLSGTYLCMPDQGAPFVRKDVSLVHNREYGFQRWYSQLKRMQRYAELFPGVFPALRTYGMLRDPAQGDMAYFDMEYIDGAVTVQEFLMQCGEASDRPPPSAIQPCGPLMQPPFSRRAPSTRPTSRFRAKPAAPSWG